jgi:hypothetical protein
MEGQGMKASRLGVMAGTMAAAFGLVVTPASADSGVIYSGGGSDCAGEWLDGPEDFRLADRAGGKDNDYCYVEYGSDKKLSDIKRRLTIPEDGLVSGVERIIDDGQNDAGDWFIRSPDLSGIRNQIYFKVCEERENDPDHCSNVVGHAL